MRHVSRAAGHVGKYRANPAIRAPVTVPKPGREFAALAVPLTPKARHRSVPPEREVSMISSPRTPRVALVYPPYGPLAPPLGLALLSAGIKKLGFDCRTFYWNIDFIRSYPARQARRRVILHRSVSYLFPLNEWVFLKEVFPDSDEHDPRITGGCRRSKPATRWFGD